MDLNWSVESIQESSKKVYAETNKKRPTESLELFSPTWKASVALPLRLRKLDGSLRTQLELPRQPSEGCSVGALGPVVYLDRLWSRRRRSNIIKIDVGPLPLGAGQLVPSAYFWVHFGSLLGVSYGTHVCPTSEAASASTSDLLGSGKYPGK